MICRHCYQAITSRGEKLIGMWDYYEKDEDDPATKCDFCEEELIDGEEVFFSIDEAMKKKEGN